MRFLTDSRGLGDPKSEEVPLLVIGAGLPRAATSSMQAAFEKLGCGPCMHMAEILPHPSRLRLFIAALREKNPEVRQKMVKQLIHGHRSICDLPVVYFTPDMMNAYSEAKIVLNQRPDPEVWARSAEESFWFFFSPWFYWVGLLWSSDRMWYTLNMESIKLGKEKYGSAKVFSAEMYNKYNEEVLAEAKKRNREVLQFKAEDGWEPLCRFLGKDIPGEPFPRLNEKKTFQIVKYVFIAKGLLSWVALFGGTWGLWRVAVMVHVTLRVRSVTIVQLA